ncbi:MAG TPA: methylated-DNA--[protein]-cysteine S-methyltransferase [Candidatus Chromulinivoraceae bacterium]|nr:methylated-DNA--[protein]-cysteine S-methyltransferase [Candidatus Chromulinivoraceae bacterium]
MIYYSCIESPLGKLTISTDGLAILALHIEGDRYFTYVPENWVKNQNEPLLEATQKELAEYFVGKRSEFSVPVQTTGTDFQMSVWKALQTIPAGSTTSYGELARQIGKPSAVRAVGTAVGRNPVCIMIPCHRVLTSTGQLGGYVAGTDCKQRLLALEDTTFVQ